MTESNEPPLIKYEEIFLPDELEDSRPGTSQAHDVDEVMSSEEEGEEEDMVISVPEETEDHIDEGDVRNETISTILDFIFPPRKIQKDGAWYLLRLSREASDRKEILDLNQRFEDVLKERQIRMNGFCPIRRELYDLLFDELIRQATIDCCERGSLLLRVRDEFRMTIASFEKLYESGVEYGSRKAAQAETELNRVEIQYKQLKEEAAMAEKRIRDLEAEIAAEEAESQQLMDMEQTRHLERMEYLKKLNKQLNEQLTFIS